MASLTYSRNALNVLTSFHRKEYIIYLEGDEDVPFWACLFREFGLSNFYLKSVGGSPALEPYIKSIIEDDADIYVARDCDYSDILSSQISHQRIIYTYGYSIENSLYCPESIARAIAVYKHDSFELDSAREVEEWLEEFVSAFRDLIILDIASIKHNKGIQILGEKCNRFLKSNQSPMPCLVKIEGALDAFRSNFTEHEISETSVLIDECCKPLFYLLRGHFLTNAIINYIQYHRQNESEKELSSKIGFQLSHWKSSKQESPRWILSGYYRY